MSFTFFVEMKHTLIQKGFITKTAVQLVLGDWVRQSLPNDSRNESLPPEKRSLLPFSLKHFLCLIDDSFEIH